jgi:hypothetical protein
MTSVYGCKCSSFTHSLYSLMKDILIIWSTIEDMTCETGAAHLTHLTDLNLQLNLTRKYYG